MQNSPDILFYACGGEAHVGTSAPVKVHWVSENVFPNFNICDFAISHVRDSMNGKNLYFPYAMEGLSEKIELPEVTPCLADRPFGIFIASQESVGSGAILRKEFTAYLSAHYKKVDCPGKVLHNVDIPELGGRFAKNWNEAKRKVIGRYKFLISFENTNTDGYITEKLVDAFASNTVPIYWGSEGNLEPFGKDAVICANDYPDFDSLIERIREVDENDELYLSLLNANPLRKPDFWELVKAFHLRRVDFLNGIYEKAMIYKTTGLMKPDRGVAEFDLSGRFASVCAAKKCAILSGQTPFHEWWRGTTHFYFIRPGKPHSKACPFLKLYSFPRSVL